MKSIILSGCCGKMGKAITACVESRDDCCIVAGIDILKGDENYPVFTSFNDIPDDIKADFIIDFSHPSLLNDLLNFAANRKLPTVIATTGLSDNQLEIINNTSKYIPIFFSANMSIGVSLVSELAKKAAKVIGDTFDIEIVEMHHNQKIDAPSGTALMLADSISEALEEKPFYEFDRHSKRAKRTKNEIGIHAVRGGTIVGEHEIIFAGPDEVIKISHSAYSKQLFSNGSVNAGMFLLNKEAGLYNMKDLVNE